MYQFTAASRTLYQGDYRPQIPVLSVLCPQLNLLKPPNKTPRYATAPSHDNLYSRPINVILYIILYLNGSQKFETTNI